MSEYTDALGDLPELVKLQQRLTGDCTNEVNNILDKAIAIRVQKFVKFIEVKTSWFPHREDQQLGMMLAINGLLDKALSDSEKYPDTPTTDRIQELVFGQMEHNAKNEHP